MRRRRVASSSVWDIIVIGSGPGGLAAAISARRHGAERVLLVERDRELGGILLQCVHHGFGLEMLGQDLPGPAYAQHYIEAAADSGVEALVDTMVLGVDKDHRVSAVNRRLGYLEMDAKAVVLAMGCRERTRPQIRLPGSRPAGVYTAGTAQRFVNVEGLMPGHRFVILGSGDIGMIMARRLTLEGAKVERVLEMMPFVTGLMRNYVQCLLDYDIPLDLSCTVNRIVGRRRVEAVETVRVDARGRPIAGTERTVPCDTLLLSVGLIPENELSRGAGIVLDPKTGGPVVDQAFQASVPGIFAAGNVVHVYDLVDWVTEAANTAGQQAARFALGSEVAPRQWLPVEPGDNVRYVVPQRIEVAGLPENEVSLQMRVREPIEAPAWIDVHSGSALIARRAQRYVRPGEMLTVKLTESERAACLIAGELTVSARQRKA
jgi:NADPH-dependent 2,4-dienoyl-CoA reductase/sulfur reductase-like enzyme